MGAKGRVVAGDYKGMRIVSIGGSLELFTSYFKHFSLNKNTLESYEVVDKVEGQSGGSSTFVDTEGNVIMGVSSSTETAYTLALNFRDGKRCLAAVDEEVYKIIRNMLFDAVSQPKAQSISGAEELLQWKELMEQGTISAEEFEGKKKQLLGL